MSDTYVPRLKSRYKEAVIQKLVDEFGYRNCMQVPRMHKIVLNLSMKDAIQNQKLQYRY